MHLRFQAPFAFALLLISTQACAPETTLSEAADGEEEGWASIGLPEPPKGGDDITGPYELVEGWPQNVCGEGFQGGAVGGVFAAAPDRVFVFQRGCLPALPASSSIVPARNAAQFDLSQQNADNHPRWDHVLMILNRDGALVDSWERHNALFVRPHRVRINPNDPDGHIWLIDDGAHSVYKFTSAGELVMTLGEFRVPGNDQTHFNRPTDVAWLPNGDFFVSDGYNNTRVVKFNAEGQYLLEWGQPGEAGSETRPSYFNTVHGVVVDAEQRVYVADRANHRIQIFDQNGQYLNEWYTRYPYDIEITADQHLWVGDGHTNKMLKYDLDGRLLYSWGTFGAFPGGIWGPHQFSVDSENNLYIADVHIGRVQKFRPKAGVNPALLVGQR
jgi:peptidylamidoglycolate lyase